jgi:hypothetical protein
MNQQKVRLLLDMRYQLVDQPRFSDSRNTRKQYGLTVAFLDFVPPVEQQAQFA